MTDNDNANNHKEFESLKEIESLKGVERLANRARQRLNEISMDEKALEYWESFFKQELEKKRTEWDELDRERVAIEVDERRRHEIEKRQQEIQRKHRELETVLRKLCDSKDMLRGGFGYTSKLTEWWYDIYYDFKDEYSGE